MELTNKQMRDQREFETLFKNPKHARAMWSQAVLDRYTKTAMPPVLLTDKDGELLPQCRVELAVWEHLKKEIEDSGSTRYPTEGEMMEACQQYYARHSAASYVARRDSMGAKPVDETKQNIAMNNPLENFSDEELEIMQKALEEHKKAEVQITCPTQP
jgi:hypothetical protein